MNYIKRLYHYSIEKPEFCWMLFILIGIISFNKDFAYIGVANIYITEFTVAILLFGITVKFVVNRSALRLEKSSIALFIQTFWPLAVILIFACITLVLDRSFGFQALRHSLIFLYTVAFILVFSLSIKDVKQLDFILIYTVIVFSSLFNGLKIITYKYLNYTLNYEEQERVLHNETDIICASLSLLGILVYHKLLWKKSKALTIIILALNLAIIILAVKRSALACIIPSIVVYLLISEKKNYYKHFARISIIILIVLVIGYALWFFLENSSFTQVNQYVINKFSLTERNTNWRLQAWNIAFHKFLQSPLWGIGYGEKILTYPLQGTDTHDPHNSILAFLVRHGVIMFLIFVTFIVKTYRLLYRGIKNSQRGESLYYAHLFLCMGLTAMIFFSFFNVVLENQYEGIFFHLFLSGVYVIQAQKISFLQTRNENKDKIVNGIMLIVISSFLLFAFSPYNKVKRVYLYSSQTNASPPIPFEGKFNSVNVTPSRDRGIVIRNTEHNEYVVPRLSWIFPPQAAGLNLTNYELVIEYENILNDVKYSLEYDDGSVLQLKSTKENDLERIKLDDTSTQKQGSTIKILTLDFPHFDSAVIKNIYVIHKK